MELALFNWKILQISFVSSPWSSLFLEMTFQDYALEDSATPSTGNASRAKDGASSPTRPDAPASPNGSVSSPPVNEQKRASPVGSR